MQAAPSPEGPVLRLRILDRQAKVIAARPSQARDALLAEIEAALRRIDEGIYGLCETCHDPIEADRLEADPLLRYCLDHLSARELEAHQQDLMLATRIQANLLPPGELALEHWETHYRYEPAGPVGGDYCEVATGRDGRSLFFAVGDVAGKGVAASLLMTHLSAIIRSLLSLDLPLGEIMSRANRLFCESTMTAHYATLVCGRATGDAVEICNAGHCPVLVLRRDAIQRLDSTGLPLGLFCATEYPVTRLGLGQGDSLVLYSDGVTETQDPAGHDFGADRLGQSLRRQANGDLRAMAQAVASDLTQFRAGLRQADDVTLLIVRRRGSPSGL